MATLFELIEKEHPSETILETFRDYAESGCSISPSSIGLIVDKSHLKGEELEHAYQHLQTGMTRQIKLSQGIAGLEYFQSMNYIAQKIAETITPGDATRVHSDDSLVTIRSELVMAHNHKSRDCLDKAVKEFQKYVLRTNPDEFALGASTVKITDDADYTPGLPGIFTKTYNLDRYGGSIAVHDYLMGIHSTNKFEIAEAPARK